MRDAWTVRQEGTELSIDPSAWALIDDPIWVYDIGRGRMVWANSAALAFWHIDNLDNLRARDFGSVSDVTKTRLHDYADRFALGESVVAMWTLYPANEPTTVKCRCADIQLTNGGSAMMVHVIGSEGVAERVRDEAEAAEAVRDARDSLARAEARFRTFAEAGSDWLWETDSMHRFVYSSASICEHMKHPLNEFLGRTRHELLKQIGAEPDTDEIREKWVQHRDDLNSHRSFRDFKYSYRTASGEIGHSAVSGDPVFDSRGCFRGYRGVGRSITIEVEAERRERTLVRERDAAVTANTVMNRFLATMSHELRTPLNAIIGFSEVLSEEIFGKLGNDAYRDYANDILKSSQHLLSIVNDLLELSRLDSADFALETLPVNVLAEEIVSIAEGLTIRHQVYLERHLPAAPFDLEVDRRGIKQVILNLLSNAIKFSNPGGTVSLSFSQNNGDTEITVRDAGCGIAAEKLEHIFEPFRAVEPHHAGSGAGLGLWITKNIVDAHGGKIIIDSKAGAGTTATVRLPVRAPKVSNDAADLAVMQQAS